jgi:hypothetical protein
VELDARAEDPVAKTARHVCQAVFTMVAAEGGVAVPVRLHGAPPRPAYAGMNSSTGFPEGSSSNA